MVFDDYGIELGTRRYGVVPRLNCGQFVEHWNPSILQEIPALFRISIPQGTVERTRS
jgi:hypothetical protein